MVAVVERFSLALRVSMMKPPRFPGGEAPRSALRPASAQKDAA
jgi:hypothetical protein